MAWFDVSEKRVSVPVEVSVGGGMVDGRLLSLYKCPGCGERLRFVAVFESRGVADQAMRGLAAMERKMQLVQSGRSVVGSATLMSEVGPRIHGKAGYGYGPYYTSMSCSLVPFYGTERELAMEVLKRLHGEEDRVKFRGRVDLTRTGKVQRAVDAVDGRNPPLLLYEIRLLSDPAGVLVGGWDRGRESIGRWQERVKDAPDIFLSKVLV